ncbi:MAG: prepilin-type N-terminal cleavage/methylation domain-containing protein [Deltaproteobacteria bacterium]|nr:prepilin-type N-terminal cleavage/methylation domain-containing protein [Deltaproteobacteria bacterium]
MGADNLSRRSLLGDAVDFKRPGCFSGGRKGFTLIELLVVIAVIALLLSIITPALHKAKSMARFVMCASNQRQIVLAAVAYSTGNNGEMPPHMGLWTNSAGNSWWAHPWHVISHPADSRGIKTAVSYGIVFGDSLPSYNVWYCPLSPYKSDEIQYTVDGRTMSIEDLYEERDFSWITENLFVPIGYLPLWRYGGFAYPGINAKAFVGPKRQSDSISLIFADNLHYADHASGWRSNHPFDEAIRGDRFYTLSSDVNTPFEALGKVKYNAGYKDGHVKRFKTDGGTVAQDDGRNCTYHIPRMWQ